MTPTFILLRGLARETEHWGQFLPELKKRFPDSPVHGLDIPGAGKRHQEKCPLSVSEITTTIREEFLGLDIPKDSPVVCVAVSLGGMIAKHWSENHPSDFKAMILINTSFSNYSGPFERLRPTALLNFIRVAVNPLAQREFSILHIVSNNSRDYQKVAGEWNLIRQKRPVKIENVLRQLTAASRFKASFKSFVPTLVLAALQDRMVNVDCSREIAKRLGLPIVVHPWGGHDLSTDDPAWVADQIKGWLQGLVTESLGD